MKLPEHQIKKIVVFRALQLGDLLCSIPGIRSLRQGYPNAEITLVSLPWAKFLVDRFPNYFNAFISFPGYPGLPEQPYNAKDITTFLVKVQQQEFDLAIQLQGNGTITNPLVTLFGARHVAGFYKAGQYKPDENLYTEYSNNLSEVERLLQLMEHLGLRTDDKQLEFPLVNKDYEDLENAGFELEPREYVCIHPGSRGQERRWDPKHFAALGDYCIENGFKVIVTGTKDEAYIVEEVIKNMRQEPINASGKTSLGAVGVLIKNAFALLSNCTGVSHIASALKTPSIVISLDGEPERWAGLNKHLHTSIDWTKTQDINVVYKALEKLLNNQHNVVKRSA
jgi:ADP-heptose:LPS heptosyltransferase